MRRKHVLMTTALMALFTACSNEDILESAQNNVNGVVDAQRPTVDNVILSLLDDAPESRLGFGGNGYLWETGDVLGALLMDDWNDNVLQGKRPSTVSEEEWNDYTWTQRYILSDQIHTDYPFTRQEDGTWTTNAKMQEGNYFFAFPFKTYEGKREAMHDLSEQEQDGVTQEALQKAYAKNNFFIGYSRIHAGTAEADVINANIKMTPVLGAVGITVKNVGTGKFTVEKIVLKSNKFATVIKVDPTKAKYKGEDDRLAKDSQYNINIDNVYWNSLDFNNLENSYFNYANYEEMTFDGSSWVYNDTFAERYTKNGALVNNTEKSDNYNRDNALRAVINPVKDTDHRVELTVTNSPELKSQESARFVVMTNIYEYDAVEDDPIEDNIYADIYTDRGIVQGVRISDVNGELRPNDGVTVISENPIVEIAPDKVNKVTLEIDDNSVQAPKTMAIYNEADLKQFIEWNKGMRRMYTATLMNDITLTKDMSDMLTAADWANATLKININSNKKLTIASDVASNILDKVMVNGTVFVENNLELSSNSYVNGLFKGITGVASGSGWNEEINSQKIKIAEGASVTVKSAIEYLKTGNQLEKSLNIAENKGTFTIDADVDKLAFNNESKMTVNAEVTLSGDSENNMKGELTIGENGRLNCGGKLTNDGGKIGGIETYAVINNNGQIYNLENGSLGKVIVGEKATVTNVNSNAGIIDISSNIETDLNTKAGTIAYTVASGKSVSMAAVNKAGITELTVNGGSVTAATDDDAIDAASVAKVIVTENGGTVGGEKASAFSGAAFEINGDATLQNLTIGGNVEVKAGTTTIKGTVDAKNSIITLASYDNEKYVSHDATLFVPTSSDKLTANAIAKDANSKAGKAYVNNNGAIETVNGNENTSANLNWKGNKPSKIQNAETKDLICSSTLKDLKDNIDELSANQSVGKITISNDLDMSNADNKDYVSVLAGKDVVLKADITNLTPDYKISMKSLTLEDNVTIKGTNLTEKILPIVVVEDLNLKSNTLTLTRGCIQIEGSAQINTSSTHIKYSSMNQISTSDGGKIITSNVENPELFIQWNVGNRVWEALN